MTPDQLRPRLVAVAEAVRDQVLEACRAQTVEQLAAYDDSGPGDTAFAVDRVSEERLLELVADLPVRLVAEGVEPQTGDAEWTLLADPLDGTRPLAHQKRSAWVLLGATRGSSLAELEVSVAVEVPTVKAGWADVLSAVRSGGTRGERVDLRTGSREPLAVQPSRAKTLEQGYGSVARYFPGAREELAAIDDALHRRILGPARPGKAQTFEDQYCTGGTLVEVAVGHDRWAADLRPLLGDRAGICAHPYDLAGWLVAAEAGVHVVRPDGTPLDAPLDLTADVAWVAYANDDVRALVEPALHAELAERGLLSTPLQQVRRRGPVRGRLLLLGPAFVAAIAYVDPGNFATNFSAGAEFGYRLAWVIVLANLMAMLIQSLSGKIGLATGRNLPELCREHFPRPVTRGLWVQAELVAMATDLAEVIGGAIALNLLFGLPLLTGGVITAGVAFALLGLQGRGYRPFELAITGLLAVIALGFVFSTVRAGVDGGELAAGFVPSFAGVDSVLLATGILGATVMPHVIYLHSALTQDRIAPENAGERRSLLRSQRVDVVIAMGLAGLVNLAMLVIAARLFFGQDLTGVDTLEGAHAALGEIAGAPVAFAFAIALLASGFASSGVGTYAGQVVMQGFLQRRIPLLVRRAITMAPALVVLAIGVDPTQALVLSQVVLSFGIPFALVPLVLLTRRPDVMGALVNRSITTATAWVVAALVIALNGFLLVGTFL